MTEPKFEPTDLNALDKVHEFTHCVNDPGLSVLEIYLWLTRLGAWTESTRERLKVKANDEFKALQAADPRKQSWKPVPFAILVATPPPTSCVYPPDLLKQKVDLDARFAAAKVDGTAVKSTGLIDPLTQLAFKFQLTEV